MDAKKLFLIDASGALISCIMLGLILVTYNPLIGMPIAILQYLAIVAFLFSLFSISNYYFPSKNQKRNLSIIAILNLAYALTTLVLVIYYWNAMKLLGLAYFFMEILIILFLAKIELRLVQK
jgi:small-conductance mechanosensitive channel